MSEQDLDEIVQITVEEFNQADRTGKILVKHHYYAAFLLYWTCWYSNLFETYLTCCDGVLPSSSALSLSGNVTYISAAGHRAGGH